MNKLILSMKKHFLSKHFPVFEIVTVILFLLFFRMISKVNFMQNDDWNRTTSVLRFMSGDTSLLELTATTFYVQGMLGVVFASIFGISKLPFLTLIFSVLDFYIFARILHDHFNLRKVKSIIFSLIFFFNPLHIYSSIGFMTENYTMFFMLLSLYFLLQYEEDKKPKNFVFFNISGILSFFTKQNGIIFNVAYIPYLIIKKRYKEALIQIAVVGSLFAYYFFLFPQTKEMQDKGFIYENFSDGKYVYSLIYGILLVTVSFVLPFVFNLILSVFLENKKKTLRIFLTLAFSGILYFLLNKYFAPGKISWEEYPYFENTFERTGFFPRSILGTKYYFKWNYDIYRYWDLASKVLLALLIPSLFVLRKKVVNIYSISIVGYIILMLFTQVFFDRYLLPLIPMFILFFLHVMPNNRERFLKMTACVAFLFFTAFLSTQMANDFVVSNNYVWGRSESLVKEGISPENIRATMAWQKLYGLSEEPEFFFSFSSPDVEPKYLEKYSLFEERSLNFPGSIFVDPMIFLYRKK